MPDDDRILKPGETCWRIEPAIRVRIATSKRVGRNRAASSMARGMTRRSWSRGRLRETIAAIRRDLLCEHLGVAEDRLAAALDQVGSLLGAIEDLRGKGRSLVSFDAGEIEDDDSVLAENELADPESTPASLAAHITGGVSDMVGAGLSRIGFKRS